MSSRLTIWGAGSFGTALAQLFSQKGEVLLYGRDPELMAMLEQERENKKYLPGISLSKAISFTSDPEEALDFSSFIILAVPKKGLAKALEQIPEEKKVLLTTKGFQIHALSEMLQTPFHVACDYLPEENVALLAGPNLAREIAQNLPCATVLASRNRALAQEFQMRLSGPTFRAYISEDVIGVALGGALKNVYAIGAGLAAGFKLGTNALSSYVCRALAEMSSFVRLFGAQRETLFGLSGLGDLICTCSSPLSRNFTVGLLLSEGRPWERIEKEMVAVAEGAYTVRELVAYARKASLELPIAQVIYRVLYEKEEPRQAIFSLLERPLKEEKL